ncbi:PI3K/PI4K domain-containing protein [Mycena indigotica]|uniref:Phosphatidylinositol 4-kinase n=1 Tax=Mycena indigotica TaxID=2126181 RepID=A0A8H6WGC6_9AGAR|nr:PI3K/PI4K domain-containing protein [Mycena indigotica]KAF7315706.1 PI3K/PI4K domain-containing protein [Mycena indigotica]
MPDRSGYQPLASSDDVEQPTTPSRRRGRPRRPRMGSLDLSSIDAAFKNWTQTLAAKFSTPKPKATGKREIYRSVFDPVGSPLVISNPKTLDHKPPMSREEFRSLASSVQSAIEEGVHPKMITKGSSGSYFARARNDQGRVHTVAVFKPKDEARALRPSFTLALNYLYSEAAASLLDTRLQLYIVPPTELVSLSSPSFFYDWLDRNAAKKGKPLPEKIGSMQFFLSGYQDASEFLRKHPWPGRAISDTWDDSSHRQGSISKRFASAFNVVCGRTGEADEDVYDEVDYEEERVLYDATETTDSRPFYWSQTLQESFREELEKHDIFFQRIMLNTDRGADNYMIKYCDGEHEKSLIDVAPSPSTLPSLSKSDTQMSASSSTPAMVPSMSTSNSFHGPGDEYTRRPHVHVAAIDNSLSWPHEHPQGWRTYTYGWLYLPVSLIGRPFSDKTRNHFLPLLTSKEWWEETTYELEKLFRVDPDFHPKMFARQLAVVKGQAWNIVQSLQHEDEGPLELTRRSKVLVWDDEVEISEEDGDEPVVSSRMSVRSGPLPRRARSRSNGSDFPPPLTRVSSERPVPFAAKFKRVHPGTKGIDVLEHLERLDAVEASLQRLGADDEYDEDDEEVDVGDHSHRRRRDALEICVSRRRRTRPPFKMGKSHCRPHFPIPFPHPNKNSHCRATGERHDQTNVLMLPCSETIQPLAFIAVPFISRPASFESLLAAVQRRLNSQPVEESSIHFLTKTVNKQRVPEFHRHDSVSNAHRITQRL